MSVQACLNGNRRREEHDALPLTPEELARDAAAVVEAGASSLHVHPRADDGSESLDPDVCDAAVTAIRAAAPDTELSLSTGLWITGSDVARRLDCLRGWSELPDCVSLNVGEEGWVVTSARHGDGSLFLRLRPASTWLWIGTQRSSRDRLARRFRSRDEPPTQTTATGRFDLMIFAEQGFLAMLEIVYSGEVPQQLPPSDSVEVITLEG